jgi:hypothetical protein
MIKFHGILDKIWEELGAVINGTLDNIALRKSDSTVQVIKQLSKYVSKL